MNGIHKIFLSSLYSNLYNRKRELINLNSLINKEIDFNNQISEKGNLLLKSSIISLNAHWEGYIRFISRESVNYLYKNKEFLLLNNNFYKKTLGHDGKNNDFIIGNNIKYDGFEKLFESLFGKENFNKLKEKYYYSINKRIFKDKFEKYNITSEFFDDEIKLKYIIDKLVELRNDYGHGDIEKNINLTYQYYFSLFFIIFELLECITEFIGDYFINKDYISSYYKKSYKEIMIIYKKERLKKEKQILTFLKNNISLKKSSIIKDIKYDINNSLVIIGKNDLYFDKNEFIFIIKELDNVKFLDKKYTSLKILK